MIISLVYDFFSEQFRYFEKVKNIDFDILYI